MTEQERERGHVATKAEIVYFDAEKFGGFLAHLARQPAPAMTPATPVVVVQFFSMTPNRLAIEDSDFPSFSPAPSTPAELDVIAELGVRGLSCQVEIDRRYEFFMQAVRERGVVEAGLLHFPARIVVTPTDAPSSRGVECRFSKRRDPFLTTFSKSFPPLG